MLQNFAIAHCRKPQILQAEAGLIWATCLRSIAVVTPEFQTQAGEQLFRGLEAYEFLMQVICGLHSPLVGETEVFGQFKTFAIQWAEARPQMVPLIQRLLSDAKAIRSEHLNQIGVQSYGSWVRKNLVPGVVHIVGGGQLAREVLPYVEKQASQVVLHVRDPRKVDFFTGEVQKFETCGFKGGTVILAAPVSAEETLQWMGERGAVQLFDLRETSLVDAVGADRAEQTFLLSQIFTQIEDTKKRLLPVVEKVKSEIAARGGKLAQQGLLRPQGWDDLCA